ncbi:hypothetical protein JCM8547_008162 [Rhodosporidiobolus lusitaniae]
MPTPSRLDFDAGAVPSIVLSPASPLQPSYASGARGTSPARGGEEGGGAPPSAPPAGGSADGSVEGTDRAAEGARAAATAGGGNSAPSTSRDPSSSSFSPPSNPDRRPSTAPSPSPSFTSPSSPSSNPLNPFPSPSPSSESRTFFSSLASSIPNPLSSFSALNLGSLLPSKLPGTPTMQVVSVGGASSSEGESEGEEEGEMESGGKRGRNGRNGEENGGIEGKGSMDLRIEEAADGKTFVSDRPFPPSPSSPSKPPFSALTRIPSSAAFVAASREGRVHPLTLEAVARRDSEGEALRLVRERKETERRRENSSEETEGGTAPSAGGGGGGGGGRPGGALLRKQSWTAASQAAVRMATGGLGGGRSESPVQMGGSDGEGGGSMGRRKREVSGRGLGLVGEEGEGEENAGVLPPRPAPISVSTSAARQASVDTVVPPLSASSTASFASANASTPQPATPTTASGSSSALPRLSTGSSRRSASLSLSSSSPAIPSPAPSETTKRKKSLFSRFRSSSRSVSGSSVQTVTPSTPGFSGAGGSGQSPRVSEFGARLESPGVESPGLPRTSTASAREGAGGKKGEGGEGGGGRGEKGEKVKMAKVKAKGKSTKDFGRLFLAQELVIPPAPSSSSSSSPPSSAFRPPPYPTGAGGTADDSASQHSLPLADNASQHSSYAPTFDDAASATAGAGGGGQKSGSASASGGKKKKNAVWAIKFSEDGRYLAVGGKDGVVRVWEVLSTPEDRHAVLNPSYSSSSSPPNPPFTPSVPSDSPSTLDSPPLSRTATSQPPPPAPSASPRKKCSSSSTPSGSGATTTEEGEKPPASGLPVFGSKPVREFRGHEADVLDLSWSKNNFLLSSSMDKTVRLWHVSRSECLCAFQHLDFVTSIAFHPKDDRYFLSGSLDCKLRLWNIPEKRVHIWTELPELITSVAFTRDGKLAIAGSFVGICMFFEVETFRYHSQFAAKSSRGKNSKGKKVTSLCAFPRQTSAGERLLVTTNDSRIRLYHTKERVVETKYAGHENTSSQIRASFSDDGRFIITGSEDRHVYIFASGLEEPEQGSGVFNLHRKHKDGSGYECFPVSAHIVTAALFAPTPTRQLLAQAGDPIFADGHTHVAPLALAQTLSSASSSSTMAENLVPAKSIEGVGEGGGKGLKLGGAEDAIVVVADDETGVLSIYRNSTVPPPSGSSFSSFSAHPESTGPGSGFSVSSMTNGGTVTAASSSGGAGLSREGSKRWSKGGR